MAGGAPALRAAAGKVTGFTGQPGQTFTGGDEAEIASRLDTLGNLLGVRIYGISGARTPQHSVEVGGFANDPHAQSKAIDIGVDSLLRSSASKLTDAQLKSVGLYRPFSGADEINHIQLLPADQRENESKSVLEHIPGVQQTEDAASTVKSVGDFLGKLTDGKLWLRVIEVVLGGVLLLMGLKSFTGGSVDPLGTAGRVAGRVVP